MSNEISKLLQVVEMVKQHASPDVATWFIGAVDRFMSKEDSLDACLSLKSGPGQPNVVDEYLIWKRNGFLREAWLLIDEPRPWKRSGRLANEINIFRDQWLLLSELEPQNYWSRLKTAIYCAFKTGATIPETQRRLHDIVMKRNREHVSVDLLRLKWKP